MKRIIKIVLLVLITASLCALLYFGYESSNKSKTAAKAEIANILYAEENIEADRVLSIMYYTQSVDWNHREKHTYIQYVDSQSSKIEEFELINLKGSKYYGAFQKVEKYQRLCNIFSGLLSVVVIACMVVITFIIMVLFC